MPPCRLTDVNRRCPSHLPLPLSTPGIQWGIEGGEVVGDAPLIVIVIDDASSDVIRHAAPSLPRERAGVAI